MAFELMERDPTRSYRADLPDGMPLREVLDAHVPAHVRNNPGMVVYSQGTEIVDVDAYRIRRGDRILVGLRPLGGGGGGDNRGKNIGQIIAGIVLIVVGVFTTIFGDYSGSVIQLGVGLLLGGLAGLMIQPPSVGAMANRSTERDSAYYGITGQSNAARPYQSVLKLYGQHRMFPALAANPVVYNAGTVSSISAIYDFGIGRVDISDIRIGDTPADVLGPEFRYYVDQTEIQPELATRRVSYQQLSYVLQQYQPLTLTTAPNTLSVQIDLAFAQGLYASSNTGQPIITRVEFDATWQGPDGIPHDVTAAMVIGIPAATRQEPTGTTSVKSWVDDGWVGPITRETPSGTEDFDQFNWRGADMGTTAPGGTLTVYNKFGIAEATLSAGDFVNGNYQLIVTADTPDYVNGSGFWLSSESVKPQVASLQIQFPAPGQYDITLNRITAISTDYRVQNTATVSQIKSFTAGPMFALRSPHTMLEMRVQGSERLSGVVQNLSAVATGVLPTYDAAGVMVGEVGTRNPAWIAIDVLTGEANPQPIPLDMIDWPSWVAFADYCGEWRTWNIDGETVTAQRHTCDVVIDYLATVRDVVDSVLSVARAGLVVTQTGKYGVLIDEYKTVPRQVITPANSFSFSATRAFPPVVHAFRVMFNDADRNYQPQEVYVFADGYSIENATNVETLSTFGLTNYQEAWAWGRYMMAQRIHRAETFVVKMDAEHLAVQRGDLVYVQHDVPKVGGRASRVIEVQGSTVIIDNDLATVPEAYTVRLEDGTIRQGSVTAVVDGSSFTLDDATGIQADDLIVLGLVDRVTRPYLVQSIVPEQDMIATLTLSVYEPAIYEADQGVLPPWNPGFGDDLNNATDLNVTSVTPVASVFYVNRYPWARVTINFTVDSPFYAYADVFVRMPDGGLQLVDTARGVTTAVHEFAANDAGFAGLDPLVYVVQPYTSGGVPGGAGEGSLPQVTMPQPLPPPRFDLDLKRDTLGANWDHPTPADGIAGYEIRYDPTVGPNASIDNATIIARNIAFPTTSVELPTRLGTYFIKSLDVLGRRSTGYTASFTPGENLWNLNSITHRQDAPNWQGIKYGFTKVGSTLVSSQVAPGVFHARSEYYYADQYDGGHIYQTRFTSKINAAVLFINSLMAQWEPLASADPIAGHSTSTAESGSISDLFDVWHEIRWTSTQGTMSTWVPLEVADPIGLGEADYGEWRRFYVGDYTARWFQFRLVAEYIGPLSAPDVGVELANSRIDIDMPDRTDAAYDVAAPNSGYSVTYDPAFMDRPAVAITIDTGAAGDSFELTNSTRTGFTVRFFDATGTPVARQFDWMAKGYGAQSTVIPDGLSGVFL